MGEKTTRYGDRRYQISSEAGIDKGTTQFMWSIKQQPLALKGQPQPPFYHLVILIVREDEYTKPETVWSALPEGIVADEHRYQWVEDCREVAHYINSVINKHPKKHRSFRKQDMPRGGSFVSWFKPIPTWAAKGGA